jgi:hypothetical protein
VGLLKGHLLGFRLRRMDGARDRPSALRTNKYSWGIIKNNSQGGNRLARSNYQSNKRQKELARKKKQEQKRERKLDKSTIKPEENPDQSQNEGENLLVPKVHESQMQ